MPREAEPRLGAVRDWMTRAPITVPEDCPVRVALGQMQRDGVRHLLVVDGDRLSGILSNRDVRRLALHDPGPPLLAGPVRAIMTEDPVTVAPEPTLALLVMETALSEKAAATLTLLLPRSTAVASVRALASTLADALTLTAPPEVTVTLLPMDALLESDSTSTEIAAATPTPQE